MQLLNLLRKVDQSRIEFEIVQFGGGRIFKDEGYKVHELNQLNLVLRILNFILLKFAGYTWFEYRIRQIHKEFKANLWYINSINTRDVSPLARSLKVPYIVHCHELPYYYGYSHSELSLSNMLKGAALAIGCSKRVQTNLASMGAPSTITIYESVDVERIAAARSRAQIRKSLGIPETAFIWGMAGGGYYRKGADFVPEILQALKGKDVYFIWIGDLVDSGYSLFVKALLKNHNISNFVVTGNQNDRYFDYLDCIDGFCLTSREDPFPLVMIEAAALGKPIVSFASGGVEEFFKEGMGKIVKNFDIRELTAAMDDIMQSSNRFNAEVSRERAKEFDAARIAHQWQESLLNIR
jgi:glycosyltransferase involved in cell wall biosynthesis